MVDSNQIDPLGELSEEKIEMMRLRDLFFLTSSPSGPLLPSVSSSSFSHTPIGNGLEKISP